MSREAATAMLTGTTPVPVVTSGVAATPPPATATTPKLDSDRFAHLAKQESEVVKQKLELKRDKEEVDAFKKKQKDFEELKVKDPVAAMRMMGFSETDIFNYMAQQEAKPELTPEEKAAKAAEDAATAKLTEWEKQQIARQKELQDASDKEIIGQFKMEINKTIETEKEKYRFCAHNGPVAEQMIYNLALQIAKDSGGTDVISKNELIDLVEEQLKYEYEEAKKAFEAKEEVLDVSKNTERTRTVTPGTPAEPQKPAITRTRALTNAATATGASSASSASARKTETREQKKERLAGYLREGKLG